MQLRWTEEAAADLEHIADYLFEHTPDRAVELALSVFDAPSALVTFPHRSRPGKKDGTRELVLSPLPYVVRTRRRDLHRAHSARHPAMAVGKLPLGHGVAPHARPNVAGGFMRSRILPSHGREA
ncbi:MAG: type II toxin-antitoxin system RelE/ParE family toxin [Bryobacteraceae bacterium]